jgi:hypothetical protein
VLLKRGLRVRRRALAPQLVDEAIARQSLAGVEKEDRENASLSCPAERQLPLAVVCLERAEYAEVERARQTANVPRCRCQSTDSALRAARERLAGRSALPTDGRRSAMRPFILTLVIAALAGCGGSGDSSSSEPLRAGIYEYELTEQYLLDNGISQFQAEQESGVHEATLGADGSFVDSWKTADGKTGSCRGTYEEGDANRVTFKWTSGCFGDWEMKYSVDGDVVTWSDQEALPPYDDEEEQKVTEVFNGVPWTRAADAS